MLTREYEKRCSISGFRCMPLSAKPNPAAQEPADRVSVNFLPSTFPLDFGGVAASASLINAGLVGGFGLIFSGAGDELFLSTRGTGQPFSDLDVSDLAERLQRVLVAMTADPGRSLLSVDVLDAGEHARLDEVGNRAVLTRAGGRAVSIPALFAAQVARAPRGGGGGVRGAFVDIPRARRGGESVGALLTGQGVGPGQCVALLFSRSR